MSVNTTREERLKLLERLKRLKMEPTVAERRARIAELLAVGAVRASRMRQGLPIPPALLPPSQQDED